MSAEKKKFLKFELKTYKNPNSNKQSCQENQRKQKKKK
jgi:hypothetical protein